MIKRKLADKIFKALESESLKLSSESRASVLSIVESSLDILCERSTDVSKAKMKSLTFSLRSYLHILMIDDTAGLEEGR